MLEGGLGVINMLYDAILSEKQWDEIEDDLDSLGKNEKFPKFLDIPYLFFNVISP